MSAEWIDTEMRYRDTPLIGPLPAVWFNTHAIDGDASPFLQSPPGSIYGLYNKTYRLVQYFTRRHGDNVDAAFGPLGGVGVISEFVEYSDFTDGGGAAGTYTMKQAIPVGAVVLRSNVHGLTGFTGDSSATLTIGDGTDGDRYNTGTPSVFTTAAAIDMGVVSGTAWHSTAKFPVLTITSGTDWGAVVAGKMNVTIFYLGN